MSDKISFGQMDTWNKLALIGGWIGLVSFLIGFIMGILGI